MQDRTLLYNCCDNEYTHFIPLFCAAALFSNDNIDIEIGVNVDSLTVDEENALNKLRDLHKDSIIKTKYNFYNKTINYSRFDNSVYDGKTMWANTVRFISEPEIKNTYTYICDIDVIMLMRNFYNYHINIMKEYETDYSNWVRDNDRLCLTGLHFVKTNKYYPVNYTDINLIDIDEHILKKIQQRICSINTLIPRRPVCGLHFSKNQRLKDQLKLSEIFINELNSYKETFFSFISSDEYKCVKSCNTTLINEYINEFTKYYNSL